jgi:MoxR-like ATPase
VVKRTTSDVVNRVTPLFTAQEIIDFQPWFAGFQLQIMLLNMRGVLVSKTRPDNGLSNDYVKSYLDCKVGPRASQNLIYGKSTCRF